MKKTLDDYIETAGENSDRHHQVIFYAVKMTVKNEWDKDINFVVTKPWLKNLIREIIFKSRHYHLKHTEHNAKTIDNQVTQIMGKIAGWKKSFKPLEKPKGGETRWSETNRKRKEKTKKVKKTFFNFLEKSGKKEAKMLASEVRGKNKLYSDSSVNSWIREQKREQGIEIKQGGKRENSGNKISKEKANKIIELYCSNNWSFNKISKELGTDKRTIKDILEKNNIEIRKPNALRSKSGVVSSIKLHHP